MTRYNDIHDRFQVSHKKWQDISFLDIFYRLIVSNGNRELQHLTFHYVNWLFYANVENYV